MARKTPKRPVPLRLDVELADWADAYAAERGSTRTAVYEMALRELAVRVVSGGVPELAESSGRAVREDARGVRPAVGRGGSSPGPAVPRGPVRERPLVSTAAELMLERQKRLNRGRGGS